VLRFGNIECQRVPAARFLEFPNSLTENTLRRPLAGAIVPLALGTTFAFSQGEVVLRHIPNAASTPST
jgi:hypothetical protein